ncbi:MAG TPA: hypothetical protein P5244_09880, partial [Syntrophales bacterium]|nr:hypothetical protein [Syntrophales bacterium]
NFAPKPRFHRVCHPDAELQGHEYMSILSGLVNADIVAKNTCEKRPRRSHGFEQWLFLYNETFKYFGRNPITDGVGVRESL